MPVYIYSLYLKHEAGRHRVQLLRHSEASTQKKAKANELLTLDLPSPSQLDNVFQTLTRTVLLNTAPALTALGQKTPVHTAVFTLYNDYANISTAHLSLPLPPHPNSLSDGLTDDSFSHALNELIWCDGIELLACD